MVYRGVDGGGWASGLPWPHVRGWTLSSTQRGRMGLPDLDGDGFPAQSVGGEDCNDADPAVNPRVPERCGDGIDNNCDGVIDDVGEGAQELFEDADGDGYGVRQRTRIACEGVEGFAARVGDCDDANAAVFPESGPDLCDGIDSDCDGSMDEDVRLDGAVMSSFEGAWSEARRVSGPSVIEVCGAARESGRVVPSGSQITVRGIGDPALREILNVGSSPTFVVESGGELTVESITLSGAESGSDSIPWCRRGAVERCHPARQPRGWTPARGCEDR